MIIVVAVYFEAVLYSGSVRTWGDGNINLKQRYSDNDDTTISTSQQYKSINAL